MVGQVVVAAEVTVLAVMAVVVATWTNPEARPRRTLRRQRGRRQQHRAPQRPLCGGKRTSVSSAASIPICLLTFLSHATGPTSSMSSTKSTNFGRNGVIMRTSTSALAATTG
uniref:Putative secreted protein n=1 Tax=Anopheles darlingi TaxID=43151 RepID=A0A2M4DGC2_ANODA